jgi:hypothetical protein
VDLRLDSDWSSADAPSSGCWPLRGYGRAREQECGCVCVTWILVCGHVTLCDRAHFHLYVHAHTCVPDLMYLYACSYMCIGIRPSRNAHAPQIPLSLTSNARSRRCLPCLADLLDALSVPVRSSSLSSRKIPRCRLLPLRLSVCLHCVRALRILPCRLHARNALDTEEAVCLTCCCAPRDDQHL